MSTECGTLQQQSLTQLLHNDITEIESTNVELFEHRRRRVGHPQGTACIDDVLARHERVRVRVLHVLVVDEGMRGQASVHRSIGMEHQAIAGPVHLEVHYPRDEIVEQKYNLLAHCAHFMLWGRKQECSIRVELRRQEGHHHDRPTPPWHH